MASSPRPTAAAAPGRANRSACVGLEAARAQEAGQVRRRRIGRIELRHRRNDREDAGLVHSESISCRVVSKNRPKIRPMEFLLDIALVRAILSQERQQARAEIQSGGAVRALARSQQRQDERIGAAADVDSLACGAGCSWCCYFTVDVRAVEVFKILEFVECTFSPEEADRVFAEVRANSALLERLSADERVTRNLKCPFLTEGRCSVYTVRPQSCRNYHATDARGCEQSFEQPENLEIDPEFAPGVYQAGAAHVEAFSDAMRDEGVDATVYELNGALHAALSEAGSRERFESGRAPFVSLLGEEVVAEFDDLQR